MCLVCFLSFEDSLKKQHKGMRIKSSLAESQENVYECSDMPNCGILFQQTSTIISKSTCLSRMKKNIKE